MLRLPHLSIVIAASALSLAACSGNGTESEAASAVERDSSLAHDLQIAAADTSGFSDAADVAMASRMDSLPREVDGSVVSPASSARVASNSNLTPAPGMSGAPVVMESSGRIGAASPATGTSNGATRGAPTGTSGSVSSNAKIDSATHAASAAVASSNANSSPSAEGFVGPSCASPALPDQRRCLLGYLARSDVTLDHNYQALIKALEREAGTPAGGAEPPTVQRLRTAQRNWLVYRDDECRRRNQGREGPLWAPTRAQCLAEYSMQRTRELANALATRPAPTSSASKSPTSSTSTTSVTPKRTKHVTTRRTKRRHR